MARQDVYRKYDENGNVVDEVRFDEGTPEYNAAIEARNGSGGEVNGYYINRGTGHITSPVGAEAMSSISQLAEEMSPKIKVNDKGTGLVVSGSKEAVTSEMGTQLKKYLDDTFKYADLRSENVADAINKLNESLANQVEQRVVEGMLDVPYDDYKEYKLAMQQFQGTNPLTSTGAIPGYDRQGRKIKSTDNDKKTVNDWLEYYMKNYTATERAELFAKSLAAIQSGDRDFAKWTPYLVMSGGGYSSAPIYGFSDAEKAGTLVQNAVYNAFGKLTESAANAAQFVSNPFAWWGFARKNGINDVAHALGHGADVSLSEAKWMTEEAFNKKLDSIIGKNVNGLTSDEQAFLAVALGDSGVGAKGPFGIGSWYDVKNFITEEGNDNISREQIEKATSYQDYINARDNLSTISKYSKELSENAENLAGTKDIKRDISAAQIYAPVQSGIGSFAGTMIRFWIENGLVSGLTGGDFAPASLSDSYAESIMNVLQKIGLKRAPEALSKGLPNFLLRVVAEVPEDIVQTAIDDALTGHADEIGTLFTPDSIAENTLQNLVMRLAFTPVHAGYQWAKTKLAIQRAAKEAGMEAKAPDSLFDNSRKVQQAADGVPGAGTIVDATTNSATIRRDDGSTEVLDNVAMLRQFTSPDGKEKYPREYEILRKKGLVDETELDQESAKLFDDPVEMERRFLSREGISESELDDALPIKKYFEDYETRKIESEADVDNIIDSSIPRRIQEAWYADDGAVPYKNRQLTRDVMTVSALRNPELRNAALNKACYTYYKINPDEQQLSFEEWAETPITLYRRYQTGEPIGSDNANVLSYSMRKGGLAEETYGSEIDTITIAPKYTTGMILGGDGSVAGYADEGEVFVPTALVEGHPKHLSIEDIVNASQAEATETIDNAPSSASYKWESPDVTKTYNSEAEVFADRPTGGNLTDVRQWIVNGTNFYMTRFREQAVPAFNDSYKTVDAQHQFVRNMDYLFNLQRKGGEKLVVEKTPKAVVQPEPGVESPEINEYGVKVKRVKIGEYDNVPLDFEIADRIAKLNELGYETHNSHSGIGADHQKPSDAGGGYIDFEGSISPEKKAAIERAAKKAGMGVHESRNPFYPRTDFVVRQSNTADGIKLEDVIEMANAETVSRYGLDPENWVDDASNKGILSEALDYRGEAEKRIYEEHGGYAQPDDASRKESWDIFFRELGAEKEPDYEISGSVIGKTYENEGITYTVNEDDVRFYLDNIEPLMQGLREAGAAGVGQEAFTITGYLPHSDYDPTDLTAEDSMQQGVLWREYSGASTTSEDGNFSTGWLTPDLEERYRIFTKNMLWDSLGDEVVISKFMEELHEDGLDVDVQKVVNLVGGRKNLAKIVEKSDSAKKMVKHLVSNGELPSDGDIETNASAASMAEKIHTIYNPVYGSAEGLTQKGSVSLLTKSDWMRSLSTSDGSLYDNGGAMIVNSLADAKFLTKQIFDAIDNNQPIDVHKLFTDYISQNHRRTAKGASYIADKWMSKIAQQARNGGVTRREVTATLSNLIYGEGANRVFRFIGRMDTSKLNASNKQALDSLLFRHSMLSKIKNTSGLSANLNKLTNGLISARMKSLFWLNYKNGVLQASECIRLFTEFKLGDAIATIKRLATDKEFRELVDEWVDMLVPERFVKSDSEASVGALGTIVDNAEYSDGTLTINKLSPDAIKKLGSDFDKFANHPVEMGETLKNRVLMAGILQEAERKGLSGNEQFSYVNQRFERIGLAANEMGRLNASDSPLFRIGANLKTFQIRQLRMFINNIQDANGKKEAVTYIMKTMGWKLGLATILTKLGYSASSVLGLDPFDLMDDDYTGVDEENYTALDYAMLSPVAKLFLSGGFTSYIGDLYWAGRKAYEDSATVTEQTEKRVSRDFFPGWAAPGATFDNALNAFSGFIPGYTAGKRVYQMADLMSTGWATSSTGNKMYQAPDNPFDIATGYVFGRSNTPNARAYYQTPDYLHGIATGGLAGLGQQISREFSTLRAMFGDTNAGFRQFDPTDSQNYSDWFDGTAADEQQWNSGYYYFRNRVDQNQKDYQEALGKAYSDEDKNSLDESFNRQIGEIEDQLSRFTAAYEAKHPEGIDARKMRNLTTILNLYQPVMSDTAEERRQRELNAGSEALYRYAQAGLPAVTSYSRNKDTGEVEPLYSPQLRSALQGEYGLPKEAATQIRQLYSDKWKDLGQRYRDMLFSTKGTKNKQAIQREYINIVRQDLDPIVRLYGNNIWSNEDVENIIDDVFNSMVPKYGQSVKSYLKELYKGYSGEIRYNESGNQVIAQIDGLLNQGRTAQAKALARSLLQRVQENRTSVTREELESLQRILND